MGEHIRVELKTFNSSYVLLSDRETVMRAVVFVHGFAGNPDDTWYDFPTMMDLVDDSGWWANSDAYFFSYGSVMAPIRVSVEELRRFIEPLVNRTGPDHRIRFGDTDPLSRLYEDHLDSRTEPGYKEIVFVAHSEGAVVVRTMIKDWAVVADETLRRLAINSEGRHQEETLLDNICRETPACRFLKAKLILFAPAHCGVTFTGALGAVLSLPCLGTFLSKIMRVSPAKVDLEVSSPLIRSLRTSTDRIARERPSFSALRANILFAEDDSIVFMDRFEHDKSQICYGHNHLSVCKPSLRFIAPVTFVEGNKSDAAGF